MTAVPCDLSQLPTMVLVGAYRGRQPRVVHSWSESHIDAQVSQCGYRTLRSAAVTRLFDPTLVRPCRRCFPDYQPLDAVVVVLGVVPSIRIDPTVDEYATTRRVAVYGRIYHVMEAQAGWSDAFSAACGVSLLCGKGRLRAESEALDAGATACEHCSSVSRSSSTDSS